MTSQDNDGLWAKLARRPLVLGAGAIGLLVLGYAAGRDARGGKAPTAAVPPAAGSNAKAAAPAVSSGGGPVALTEISSGPCRTYAPEGWVVTDKNKEGTIFTVQSPNHALTAAYAGMPVNGGMVSGAYGEQFRTPHSVALYVVGQLAGEEAQADGGEEAVGPYQALRFHGAEHAGYVLYYRFPLPADPAGFGLIMRIAIGKAGDTQSVGNAGSAMAAIQCQSSLRPPPQGLYQVQARLSDHGSGQSAAGSDVTLAGTYNAQLNIGWAHDSAGRNYRVNVTEDWKNGSDGEGFYSPTGEKLQSGLQ